MPASKDTEQVRGKWRIEWVQSNWKLTSTYSHIHVGAHIIVSSRPLFFLTYHVDFHFRPKNFSSNHGFYYHGYIAAERGPLSSAFSSQKVITELLSLDMNWRMGMNSY